MYSLAADQLQFSTEMLMEDVCSEAETEHLLRAMTMGAAAATAGDDE